MQQHYIDMRDNNYVMLLSNVSISNDYVYVYIIFEYMQINQIKIYKVVA